MIVVQIAARVRGQSRRYCVASFGAGGFPSNFHQNAWLEEL